MVDLCQIESHSGVLCIVSIAVCFQKFFDDICISLSGFKGNFRRLDQIALSTGISEALVNTALGIATGALAIISYNYFTSKIDNITYAIDEIGFSIVQTFAAKH